MKIILIALYDVNSFGIRILHNTLSKAGHDVESVFFNKMKTNQYHSTTDIDVLLDFLKQRAPDLIGISLRSSFFQLATHITRQIKENLKATVIWGGTHPTISPEESIQIADMVCIGEGEEAILEVADSLRMGNQPRKIANVLINYNKEIIRNPVRSPIDIDKVAFPDWSNEDKYFIYDNQLLVDCNSELNIYKDKYYPIMASRGGPYSCTYCCNNVYKDIYSKSNIRKRSINNIMEELVLAKKTYPHLERIVFSDDMMVTNEQWVKDFSVEFKRIQLPFNCQFIPVYVKEPIIRALRNAGMSTVTMGIQSGSERVRKEVFKRNYNNNLIIKCAKLFKKYKLNVNYDLILDNPFETHRETKMTLDLLLEIPPPYHLRMYSLIYFPHTELTQAALDKGIIGPDDVEDVKQKALKEWRVNLDSETKSKEMIFLNNLISMTAIGFVPRWYISFLSNNTIIKKNPVILVYINRMFITMGRIKKGIYYVFIKRDFKMIIKYFNGK